MKKFIAGALSAAIMFSCLSAMPIASHAEDSILPSGYVFTDIAHKPGSDIYVAEAKTESTKDSPLVYYSADGGLSWTESTTKPLSGTARNYASINTQNQLEWWDSQGVFVIHGAGLPGVYTSEDGNVWTGYENLQKGGNSLITTNGDKLVFISERELVCASSVSTVLRGSGALTGYTFGGGSYYAKAAAVSSADADGNSVVYVGDKWQSYYLTLNSAGEVTDTQTRYNQFNVDGGQDPYDAVYSQAAEQFYAVDGGSGSLFITDATGMARRVTPEEGEKVTGVAVSGAYVYVGTADGKVYYAANEGIDELTEWTAVNGSASEPIKNIAADGAGFVALGTTHIYRGTLSGFSDIADYAGFDAPVITGRDVFEDVKLIGGAYSGTAYVVYGNASNGHGKVFTSSDGVNWKKTYEGSASFNDAVKNGAVWWPAEEKFIISASTKQTSGASVVSDAAGERWEWIDKGTGHSLNTDFAIGDDGKLYTINASSAASAAMYKYSSWSEEDRETVDISGVNGTVDWMNRIAVGDGTDPAVLIHYQTIYGSHGVVRNNKSTASDEKDKWMGDNSYVQSIQGAGFTCVYNFEMTDVVYSKTLDAFVGVAKDMAKTNAITVIIPVTGGEITRGPRVSTGSVKVTNAIEINNDVYAYACEDGNVYTIPANLTEFTESQNSLLKAASPANGEEANTMPVVNVFKAGAGFVAVSTDGTNSDVLLIGRNGTDYEYVRSRSKVESVSELAEAGGFAVRVKGVNNSSSDYGFVIIAAVYDGDRLLQASADDVTLAAGTSGTVESNVDITAELPEDLSNVKIKVFTWNSTDGMVPAGDAQVNPF